MGLLRFILAISVVAHHSTPIFGIQLLNGSMAVQIFFAISGFYMALILDGKYREAKQFYINRFLRLYPAFALISLATWAWFLVSLAYVGHIPASDWAETYERLSWWQRTALAFSNWTMIGQDIPGWFYFGSQISVFRATDISGLVLLNIPPAWSIGCEIWFYLMVPYLTKRSTVLLATIAALSLVLMLAMAHHGLADKLFFPSQLWFFISGIIGYRLYLVWQPPHTLKLLTVGLVAIVILQSHRLPILLIYAAMIASIPILFSLTKHSRVDSFVGNLSYPIYLVHALIIQIATNVQHAIFHTTDAPGGLTVAAVSTLAAVVLYLLVERRVDAFRQQRVAHQATGLNCTGAGASIAARTTSFS